MNKKNILFYANQTTILYKLYIKNPKNILYLLTNITLYSTHNTSSLPKKTIPIPFFSFKTKTLKIIMLLTSLTIIKTFTLYLPYNKYFSFLYTTSHINNFLKFLQSIFILSTKKKQKPKTNITHFYYLKKLHTFSLNLSTSIITNILIIIIKSNIYI